MARFTTQITAAVAALSALASAVPTTGGALGSRGLELANLARRQTSSAAALGLTDVDILQFALTLEWLEATFYNQGFQQFSDEEFLALGLTEVQLTDLKQLGLAENSHVSLLQSSIAQAGVQPVQPCQYDFGLTDAQGMVATAGVLEQVGVSAYLGAAPLLTDPALLSTAGSILTIEARHQSFIRGAAGVAAAPSVVDTALGPKAVFSLASPFITSCPEGSNLVALTAFPTLTMVGPQAAALGSVTPLSAGTALQLQSDAAGEASFCGFTTSAAPGLTDFAPFTSAGGCELPPNLTGVVYVTLTSEEAADGVLTDDITLAGPMVLQLA